MGRITVNVDDSLDIEIGITVAGQSGKEDIHIEDMTPVIEKVARFTRLIDDIKQLDSSPLQKAIEKKLEDMATDMVENAFNTDQEK